jgi:hypothetical protein
LSRNQSIFVQALTLSFLGHVIFFSIFIIEEIQFRAGPRPVSLTMVQQGPWATSRVEAATTSNPDAIDPKLVHLAEMVRRTTAPTLEAHQRAVLWEEEVAARTLDSDVLSWLMWSFRRERPDYRSMFENLPPAFAEGEFVEKDLLEIEDKLRGAFRGKTAISVASSLTDRELIYSPLPLLPEAADADVPAVTLTIAVTPSGVVRFAIPDGVSAERAFAHQAALEVRRWRFAPSQGIEDPESSERLDWGRVTVPWGKRAGHGIIGETNTEPGTGTQ